MRSLLPLFPLLLLAALPALAQDLRPAVYGGIGTGTNLGGLIGVGAEVGLGNHLSASAAVGLARSPESFAQDRVAGFPFGFDAGVKGYPLGLDRR